MNQSEFQNYLRITDAQRRHIEENTAEYHRFYTSPETVSPKIIVGTPGKNQYTTPQLLNSPELMLKNGLDTIQSHIDIGDDYLPQLRVEFGTGQVSHAYGCGMYIPEDSPACAKGHVLNQLSDIETLENPSVEAGCMKKCYEFTQFYLENKPDIVALQLPDYQGPFNNAHLIRGNDILFDFYDSPELVHLLLQKVTDYLVDLTQYYRKLAQMEEGCFYDWGILWKGSARIANCSLHMISTDFYREFISQYDRQYLDRIGGGRIHYCGQHDDGLFDEFFKIPGMSGVDYDASYHNLWDICKKATPQATILQYGGKEQIDRILSGDLPQKRNFVLQVYANSVEEGKRLYQALKKVLE